MKRAVLVELQRFVGPRAALSVFGDRWVLAFPTGRREVFDDVETLAASLAARGFVDRRAPPVGAPLPRMTSPTDEPDSRGPTAYELAAAILAHGGPPR